MEKGRLKERIYFEKLIVEKDEYGHEVYNYVHSYSTRAEIKYTNGNRLIDNQEIVYDNTRTFIVLSYVPILDTDRIKYRDKYYRILSVNDEYNKHNQKIVIAELINE